MEDGGAHSPDCKSKADQQRVVKECANNASRTWRTNESRTTEGLDGQDRQLHYTAKYRVYKKRWVGLVQLVLLNIVVSWDWISFSPVSTTSAQYFNVSETAINWMSTSFLFSFCVVSPLVIWVLNKGGPKQAIIWASMLLLAGNWTRYAGTRATGGHFRVVMLGQVLCGLAQPFALSAPSRYSDLWFTASGRIAATAVMSLANPFGAALGQLINPFLATQPSDISNMTLYIAIISTLATAPSFFIPAHPPTPPCPSAEEKKLPLSSSFKTVRTSATFWLILIPFSVYVGLFNSLSTLLNQILSPYGLSESAAGICGALLIFVGLVASAITSPILDRSKKSLLAIKLLVPMIGICYLGFIWAPRTRANAAPFATASILGAVSFCLVPVILEFLVETLHPVSPEITSTICWSGGQLFGGIFLLVSNTLKATKDADPPYNMHRALVFQAVIAVAAVPLPLCIGWFGIDAKARRTEADKRSTELEGIGIVNVEAEGDALNQTHLP
ncbi:major facilitator superfamily domain-containing protein 7-b [Bisporella sp. PMI_857]|nr:major facilitator superfamily domain-containing protein 7-b [Bisporella sp. PMI_857]